MTLRQTPPGGRISSGKDGDKLPYPFPAFSERALGYLGRNFALEPVLQGQLADVIGACIAADQQRQLEALADQSR